MYVVLGLDLLAAFLEMLLLAGTRWLGKTLNVSAHVPSLPINSRFSRAPSFVDRLGEFSFLGHSSLLFPLMFDAVVIILRQLFIKGKNKTKQQLNQKSCFSMFIIA